ncbi:MAG: DUF3320 domain-containing protein [Planctomycetes bacterium]|nr:DUF3320 domain-containing protein [Planctomycetota bacterium]
MGATARAEGGPPGDPTTLAASTTAARLERWRRGLLDLSLRNRLLNFRDSRRSIPVVCPDLAGLEDALASGEEFRLGPCSEARPPAGSLATPLEADALDRRLLEIHRAARLGLEEGGANTLYLALGLLRWFEAPSSVEPRDAPLVLLPLDLQRPSVGQGFRLRLADDEARVNTTLLKKLEADFGIRVEGLETLPQDASGLDVPLIFDRFREATRGQARWELREDAHIGVFSFTKYLMWLDLEARGASLEENAVVRHLLETPTACFDPGGPFPAEERLDVEAPPGETFCPLDADASQLAAVLAGARGRTFVLEGPPGTGKSQTITNLIAQTLAQGRTVLFVSEKMVALQVVHDRLRRVGLDPFCLELHSSKANKRAVLAELERGWTAARVVEPAAWAEQARELEAARGELNRTVEALHRVRDLGESVFQVTSRLVGLRGAPRVALAAGGLDRARLARWREAADRLSGAARSCGGVEAHPWRAVGRPDWTPALGREVESLLEGLDHSATALEAALAAGAADLGWPAPRDSAADLEGLREVSALVLGSPGPGRALLVEPEVGPLEAEVAAWAERDRRAGRFFLWRWLVLGRGYLEAVAPRARELLGRHWRGRETDWRTVETCLAWARRLRALAVQAAGDEAGAAAALRERWGHLAAEGGPSGGRVRALSAALEAHASARLALEAALAMDPAAAWGAAGAPGAPARTREAVARWRAAEGALRDWCALARERRTCAGEGLSPLVVGHAGGEVPTEGIRDALERSALEAWLEAEMARDPPLAEFRGVEQERRIERFRALDEELIRLAGQAVQARLHERLPGRLAGAAVESEVGILERELRKKTRHKALRRLFQEIPNLLPRLRPCLLMSPLSVAQYLAPAFPPYDLVVFDEASQIPVWDAVGAIARGRSLVVVGDSRQMPPTTFFQRSEDETPPEEEEVEELESILDECVAARLPTLDLKWHYRSRHEGLIAFSNRHYYENRLLTFPGAAEEAEGLGVRRVAVEAGVYDRGRSKTNRAEAEAVVEALVGRLRSAGPGEASVGVVTFSSPQQTLIEDLLERARQEEPELDRHFTGAVGEPVFVKNLENVQGDERDAILLSVCYGPDEAGVVHMHFGPLNRAGGERRLNVAITRARRELVVYSTLGADQVDTSRTAAVGVAHLKTFLDYAQRGRAALAEAARVDAGAAAESPFEVEVGRALEAKGWTVRRQVGCSGYRLDLAVVHPRRPGAFVLGIECDGATYHRARTARDRDRLRQAVLRGLGWRLHRIWSTDWWLDPRRELERAEAAIQGALAADEAGPTSAGRGSTHAATPAATPTPTPAATPAATPTPTPTPAATPTPTPTPAATPTPTPTAILGAVPYRAFRGPARAEGSPEDFLGSTSLPRQVRLLGEILEAEAPLSLDLAARRLAACWGVGRVTARIRERLGEVIQAMPAARRPSTRGEFLWNPGRGPEEYRAFRVPGAGDPDGARRAEDIPPEEVANAARAILAQQVAMPPEALAREAARVLGFDRTGKGVRDRMEEGIRLLASRRSP